MQNSFYSCLQSANVIRIRGETKKSKNLFSERAVYYENRRISTKFVETIKYMSAKLVLDIAAMEEEFFSDTAMIGIVSALPAYRFAWLLNEKLDMRFVRKPDMDIPIQSKDKTHFFSIYQFCTPLNGCTHLIYQLKSDKESLLPEVKQLDYLWLIQCGTAEEDAQTIVHHLRDINEVQLAQMLLLDKLKSHNNLLV